MEEVDDVHGEEEVDEEVDEIEQDGVDEVDVEE